MKSLNRSFGVSSCLFGTLVCGWLNLGCRSAADQMGEAPPSTSTASSPETVFENLQHEGLSCAVQKMILAFKTEEHRRFGELLKNTVPDEDIDALIQHRASDCFHLSFADSKHAQPGDHGVSALTEAYHEIVIPKMEHAPEEGVIASAVFQDSGHFNWMCNRSFPGAWYAPSDWIIEYRIPEAYLDSSDLRISGIGAPAQNYLPSQLRGRVYSGDIVRACLDFWRGYLWTFAEGPAVQDAVLWRSADL